jgi:hypothetical protein
MKSKLNFNLNPEGFSYQTPEEKLQNQVHHRHYHLVASLHTRSDHGWAVDILSIHSTTL